MTYNDFLWILMFIGFCVWLGIGAFVLDVILPKIPKLCKALDKLIEML